MIITYMFVCLFVAVNLFISVEFAKAYPWFAFLNLVAIMTFSINWLMTIKYNAYLTETCNSFIEQGEFIKRGQENGLHICYVQGGPNISYRLVPTKENP